MVQWHLLTSGCLDLDWTVIVKAVNSGVQEVEAVLQAVGELFVVGSCALGKAGVLVPIPRFVRWVSVA